jgi:LamB porin
VLVCAPMQSARACALILALASQAAAQPSEPPSEPPAASPAPEPAPVENKPDPAPVVPPAPPTQPLTNTAEIARVPLADTFSGLRFGSYGRLITGTDLRGGKPESANIVAHGPRIVEDSYLELDFSYGFRTDRGVKLRPVITLAFDGTLFHDTGDFDAQPALRNMFLEASINRHVTAWVGSRMYRGDDIYLLDVWPLDDQNTVGGGMMYHQGEFDRDQLDLAAHVGFNRLNNPFTFQEIQVPNPQQGATTVVQLNRQRIVASASASYLVPRVVGDLSMKVKVHGEFHGLPSGTRKREDGTFESLPSDSGILAGVELGLFGWQVAGFKRHLNLFLRYAKGLAAFDELAPPTTFGPDLTTSRASELQLGLSGNWDYPLGNLMVAALSRRFEDASGNDVDFNNGWEYAVDARPLFKALPDTFVGADVSYQARFPRGLNPFTERAEDPAVFQIAPMIVYSPMGPSAYDRPQLRLVYRAAYLNAGARDLYVPDDPRHAHSVVHYLGFQAEWWFNSSTYQR